MSKEPPPELEVKSPEPATPEPELTCNSCGNRFNEDDAITLYECGDCGQIFSAEDAGGNRCPDCNKFAAKFTDMGCPECSEGKLENIKVEVTPEPPAPPPERPAVVVKPEPEMKSAAASAVVKPRSSPPHSHGWFKVWRHDRAAIIEQCEGATLAVLSVWDALCDIANEKRSASFDISIGIIRTRAGTSRSTTFRAIELLEGMGMLAHKQNPIPGKKNALNLSTYTLITPSYCDTTPPSYCDTTPPSDGDTTPSPSKQGTRSDRGLKTPPKGRRDGKEASELAGSACAGAPQADSSGAEKGTPKGRKF
jgi:predicted RNA-binding Zn-ribbon protein involved in translation (DUF1610 family)